MTPEEVLNRALSEDRLVLEFESIGEALSARNMLYRERAIDRCRGQEQVSKWDPLRFKIEGRKLIIFNRRKLHPRRIEPS